MKKILVVIDMQKDFVTGSLGTKEAQAIVPAVVEKVKSYISEGWDVIFTRDTHQENYLLTAEGKKLPVEHCIRDTKGWQIIDELQPFAKEIMDKPSFGSLELAKDLFEKGYETIELIGVCTDICVVSNALIIKAQMPECNVSVDAACCAGVTVASHEAALTTMGMCQVDILK